MPEVFDWQRGDPRLVLECAVRELTAGRLVVFPTETGYQVAAAGLNLEALVALGQFGAIDNTVLAVRDLTEALRWAPGMSTTAQRLARRVWPGPVTLIVDSDPLGARSLPPSVAATVRLNVPGHEAPLAALEMLGGPLAIAPLPSESGFGAQLAAWCGDRVAAIIDNGPSQGNVTTTVVHVRGNEWTVTQSGTITADMLQALMPTTIVFVCTGNTCRSPLAEVLCKKLLADRIGCLPEELPKRGFLVQSAGLAAIMGLAASPVAVEIARECGADLSGHLSQPLTTDLLARADYLFTMTQSHLRIMQTFCPTYGAQPRLLASDGQDVPDPIGSEPAVYRECAQQILRYLNDCLPEIQPL